MTYEELAIAYDDLIIKEMDFSEIDLDDELDGLCVKNKIFIRKSLSTSAEKACILAEEIGHYRTTTGNILDQTKIENRKQEYKARKWAVKLLIRIEQFIDAFNAGVRNRYELAEFLGTTENFIDMAIDHFKGIYGSYHIVNEYIIYFEPLMIHKKFTYSSDKQSTD